MNTRQIALLCWLWAAVFVGAFQRSNCYEILLVMPLPTKSHFTTNVALAEELVRRGHQVTVFSPFPKKNPIYRQRTFDGKIFSDIIKARNLTDHGRQSPFQYSLFRWNSMLERLDKALATREMQDLIQSKRHYDVILADLSFFQPCLVAFGHKFNAPVIDISATAPSPFTTSISGNPQSFSTVANTLIPFKARMSFTERLYNSLVSTWLLLGEHLYLLPKQEALMRKHFVYPGAENLPPLREMLTNVSLVLISTHFSINIPRSFSPNMVEVGGFHIKPAKKLTPELQEFMDGAKHGVIYFSFGTLINHEAFSAAKMQTIVSALRRLKQRVIFKWDDPTPFSQAKNVLALPWTPQQEILAHPNCILFVTHGGQNSLIEVTWAGVPVLCIPIFADQFHNVRFYEESGIGKGLELEFTGDQLFDSISSIINTPSFRVKAKELSRRTRDRQESPMDRAIFWVEYVARHRGAHHLKPASVHMSYSEYLLLDVILVLLLVPFIGYKLIQKVPLALFVKNFAARASHMISIALRKVKQKLDEKKL